METIIIIIIIIFDNICVRNITIYRSLGIEIPEKTLGTQGNMEKLKNFKTINFKKKKNILGFGRLKKWILRKLKNYVYSQVLIIQNNFW